MFVTSSISMPYGGCRSVAGERSSEAQTNGSMASSVAGSCREFTGGILVCRSVSMAMPIRLTIAAGPQTGMFRAERSEASRWTLARTAVVCWRQNCLVAIRLPPITASEMQDPENLVIVTSSESLVMLTLMWVWARAFPCPGAKSKSCRSAPRHSISAIHSGSGSTTQAGVDLVLT